MGSLKVLFITSWYPTKEQPVGGVFIREHAKAVRFCNEVVVLHCATKTSNLKGLWQIEQETDKRTTEGIATYRVWRRRLPIRIISYFNFIWSVLRGFRHIVSSGFRPDILHAHIYEAGVPTVLIGKLYKIPVVITEHSSSFPRKMLSPIEVLKARLAFRWARLVLPVSYALQKGIEDYGIRARFKIIPNVVNTSVFYPVSHLKEINCPKRILFTGLLVPVKGLPYLLDALAQLRRQRDDWHLDIVGDGPLRMEYEKEAINLRIADKITFHGLKSKEEVAEFMRESNLFVLPSVWENMPCVLIEAMASGLPIVSTRTGGIPEIVDQEIGVLVPPGDSNKLAEALSWMIESLPRFDRTVIAKRAAAYRPETVGRLIHSVYERCVCI